MDNYGNIIQQPNMEYANAMYAQAENVAPLNHPGVIMVQHDGIPVMPPMQVNICIVLFCFDRIQI